MTTVHDISEQIAQIFPWNLGIVVCDMTTVHDISEQIAQIFPWNLGIALQVVEQNVAADGQVTRVEGIVSVPALGAEFASLGNHGMEVA